MTVELKDWLNSINHTKENIIDIDPDLEKDYPPYIINKCLSGFVDTILFSNEMNMFSHCLLYTSPSPRDKRQSRMPSSA